MGRTSKRDRAGRAVSGAAVAAADRAGELSQRAREGAGPLYDRVVDSAGDLAARTGPLVERVSESAGELAVAAAPVVGSAVETVSGVLEDALVRGGAAWDALRGDRVGPPVAVRRWPWALGAAVLGAAAGAVAAAVVRKVAPPDAPGAQEPHELRAVVDTTDGPGATPAPTAVPKAVPKTAPKPVPQPIATTAAAAAPAASTVEAAKAGEQEQRPSGAPTPSPPVGTTTFEL